MNSSDDVGRLAPSPTGAQHLGNARTYLLAFWSARSRGARLVLRIEDLDSPRIKSWAIDQAIEDLRWLGIDWDEGPDIGGPHAPYLQSERREHYDAALQRLIEAGAVYPCVCSRADIAAAAGAPHAGELGAIYPGTCAGWRRGDPLPREGSFCWRFRSRGLEIILNDYLAGRQRCSPGRELGDFPVTRKTGLAAYQLAVVVDDAAMGVTEIVRGDDLLPSTFWQLELYEAFGFAPPRFAHVPLVTGPDGRRLAKRHGDTRLSHFRELGVPPITIVRWAAETSGLLAAAGDVGVPAAPKHDSTWELQEFHQRMVECFDWSRVSRRAVVVERFPE